VVPRPSRPTKARIERQLASTAPATSQIAGKQTEAPTRQTAAVVDNSWQSSLAAWVRSRRHYPAEARRQGKEGVASVRIVVARDGRIIDVQVVHSSGSDMLDQATLAMFQGAQAPAFPEDMPSPQISVTLSIRYRLRDD